MRLSELDGIDDFDTLVRVIGQRSRLLIGECELCAEMILALRQMKTERGAITVAFNLISKRLAALEHQGRVIDYKIGHEQESKKVREEEEFRKAAARLSDLAELEPKKCNHSIGVVSMAGMAIRVSGEPGQRGPEISFRYCPDCGERLTDTTPID